MDFTQESLAHHLHVAVSTVTKWEQGTRVPATGTRRKVAEALQLSLIDLDRLLGIEPAIELDSHEVPSWLNTYESLVQAAGRLDMVEKAQIPGLLQIKAYAAAIERYGPLTLTDEQVMERVDVRLARQAALHREVDPLELVALIAESVLHEVVGGSEVMTEQLDYLMEMAERPNITVRLLPSDGRAACALGNFDLLTRPGDPGPFLVAAFSVVGPDYVERPELVRIFRTNYDYLASVALTPTETTRRIRDIREMY
jgi:transcriptional regulator with XRE-family HTH domain